MQWGKPLNRGWEDWFAWRPARLTTGEWVWFENVQRARWFLNWHPDVSPVVNKDGHLGFNYIYRWKPLPGERECRKPRIRASSAYWLWRIYDYAVRYDTLRDDRDLESSPSDVLDGLAYADEIRDLVRRRILYVIPLAPEDRNTLSKVSWGFTDRGIRLMRAWHERAPLIPSDEDYLPPGPSCPACGEPLDEEVQ